MFNKDFKKFFEEFFERNRNSFEDNYYDDRYQDYEYFNKRTSYEEKDNKQEEYIAFLEYILYRLEFEYFKLTTNTDMYRDTLHDGNIKITYYFLDKTKFTMLFNDWDKNVKIICGDYGLKLNENFSIKYLRVINKMISKLNDLREEEARQQRNRWNDFEDNFYGREDYWNDYRKTSYRKEEPKNDKFNLGYTRVYSGGTSTGRRRYNLLIERLELQYESMQKKMNCGNPYRDLEIDINNIRHKLDKLKEKHNF